MSLRKRSRESRTSKRSSRSSLSSSELIKNEISNGIIEKKLAIILEKDEQDMIVYAIREELMQRVMDECQKKYMEKQCVKFTVHCAYKALIQLVHLHFFAHDPGQPFYENHPVWSDDKPPDPSSVDTWAAYNVPILPKSPEHSKTSLTATISQTQLLNEYDEAQLTLEETTKNYLEMLTFEEPVVEEQSITGLSEFWDDQSRVDGIHDQSMASSEALSIFTQTAVFNKSSLPEELSLRNTHLVAASTKSFLTNYLTADAHSLQILSSVAEFPPLRTPAKYKPEVVSEKKIKLPPIKKKEK